LKGQTKHSGYHAIHPHQGIDAPALRRPEMSRNVATAIFETRSQAEAAIDALRSEGINEKAISVISKRDEEFERDHDHQHRDDRDHDSRHEHTDTTASGAGKGLAIGAGAGAVAGLAALAIPGIGPFIAAGAVAEALGVVGSAVATSAVVGGAIGGLTGALMKYGVDEEDARYFDERLKRGGYWVGVDLDETRAIRADVEAILFRNGGQTSRLRHEDNQGR
jgi:hypothetical protein